MRKTLLFIIVVSFTFLAQAQTVRKSLPNNKILAAKVDAYIKPYEDVRAFNGAVLIAQNGKVLISKGYGMANYELGVPNTPKSKFHIASLSKSFTAAAIMILQEQGKLTVSDTLNRYIPDFPKGDKITLHQLLSHTAGIGGDFSNFNAWAVPMTMEKMLELVKQAPPVAEPGARYSYSNNGYRLLAYIIEKASGQSYGEFLKSAIFDQLGMQDTGHEGANGALVQNRAYGYAPVRLTDLENIYIDWSTKTGNGSLYTTVEDLYKWDRALYNEKILKKSSLDTIFREKYGWFVDDEGKRKLINYGGRSPGYNSAINRFVNDDTCIIVLANNYSSVVSQIANDLSAMIFGEFYQIPDFTPASVSSNELDKYTGRYEGGSTFFIRNIDVTLLREGNQLRMNWSSGATTPLIPMANSKFFARPFGGVISFSKDAQGSITELVYRYAGEDYTAKKTSGR